MKKFTSFLTGGRNAFAFLALAFFFHVAYAQNDYTIQFQDETFDIQENISSFNWNQMPESSRLANGYTGWVQFYETPNQSIQDQFNSNGLELMEYISNGTYLFYFPSSTTVNFLQDRGVRAIVPTEGRFKLSEKLKNGDIGEWAQQGDQILVTLQYHDRVDADYVIADLASKQIALQQQYKGSTNIDLLIPNNCLEDLSNLPYVKWVEVIAAPPVKDDTRGRSLHRSSGLDTQGAGRNYTGEGIGVLCRDDGIVGPHIDFQGRIDNSEASNSGQTHGDGVSGIMAGSGNLDPTMRGMAAGANLYVTNYASNFLDSGTQGYINSGAVQITNSSYSDGCNAGYTVGTQTVDQQTKDIPSLLHVFSAGNSNNNNCGYGAGNQWGNITGGHKQGKNVIATANVFFNGVLVNSSSRGPAHDGRIKPDIAANGQNQNSTDENNDYLVFGGTSGAAPGIAGISAQLYEAYGDLNGGAFPESALIKATLLNTANDYGNVGPDFKFGWGIVNALRAGILIEEGRYLSDNISQGATNTHTINVPAGTAQVRFMVYWSDEAATPGASTALVNDLDLVVTDPSSGTYLPWILDSTPDPSLLDLPATTGEDHLNNMEQVLINNPAAGNYDIDITGFDVPVGPQSYYVTYEIIEDNLTVTYPNDGASFVPGEIESIHWDAVNTTDDFTLEYSTDNGSTWNNIFTVGSNITNYGWTVPADVTGTAKIRITSGSFQDESDGQFSIADQVTGLDVIQVCATDATFTWDALPNAESYDVYLLGDKYMEVVGSSTTTTATVPIPGPDAILWYAIVGKNETEGWESRRTIALNYQDGLLDCVLVDDLSLESINNSAADFSSACGGGEGIVSITVINNGVNDQTDFTLSYEISGEPAVDEVFSGTLVTGESLTYEFATPVTITTNGDYTLTTSVTGAVDEYSGNNLQTLELSIQSEATAIPFDESFETEGVPPVNWIIDNPDDQITWEDRTNIAGSDGTLTTAAYINNYSYNAAGQEDLLATEVFDLTNVSAPILNFDLAKAQYSAGFSDAMRVEISIDCGTTFTTIYEKDGLDLSTIAGYTTTAQWAPAVPTDWRTETIDLDAYAGNTAIVRFVNITGYGNSTHIDNVNIEGILSTSDAALSNVSLYPNPTSNEVVMNLGANYNPSTTLLITNSMGQIVQQFDSSIFNGTNQARIDVSNYAVGLYFITIKSENLSATKKLLVK